MLEILYEDNHLIAVNKPPGILVQADRTGDRTIADWIKMFIKDRYNKPGDVFLGTIHRIDRPASGVTVFARTSKALERMNKLFEKREVQKLYWAITAVRPNPYKGSLKHYILKDTEKNTVKAFETKSRRAKNAKLATLDYEMIGKIGYNYLIEVALHTGRPHQIRAQFAKIGCPIKGDVKYGSPKPYPDGSILLHSRELSFIHPVKNEPVKIVANPPDNQMWGIFDEIIE